MNYKEWKLWDNLSFRTTGYRKNFDLINVNDNIITEYNGTISELRIAEGILPKIIGEYGFSTINIELAQLLNVDLNRLLTVHRKENVYAELSELIAEKKWDVGDCEKIVLIHGLVIHPTYRKMGVTEEFVEMLYRDFHGANSAIIALVKPFQDNINIADYYYKMRNVRVVQQFNQTNEVKTIPAMEYYELDKLKTEEDRETNEYKLFALAKRCGFSRINENHLFVLNPLNITNRIKEKVRYGKEEKENQRS